MDELRSQVMAWSRRVRLQRSVGLSFLGLSCGLGLALVVALAARFLPLLDRPELIGLSAALAAVGLSAAILFPWVRHARTPLLDWARAFDQRFGLEDRLSTALEIGEGTRAFPGETIYHALRRDAGAAAAGVDARAQLPLRLSRRDGFAALLLLIALLLALFLPNPQQEALAQRERLSQAIAQQADQLEQAKQAIEQSSLSEAEKQAAIQALEEAQRVLSDPNVTPEEALAALNEAQSKLDALNDLTAQQLAEDLRRAGQSLPADSQTNPLANALANQDLERAADALRELGQVTQAGQSRDDETAQRTAEQIEQLARSVQRSDPELAQHLREAAQHLRQGEMAAAQQQLEQAAQTLERAQASAQAGQALERAQTYADAARRSIAQQASLSDEMSRAPQSQNSGQQTGDSSSTSDPRSAGRGMSPNGDTRSADGSASASSGDAAGANRAGRSGDVGAGDMVYAPQRVGGDGQSVVLPDAQSPAVPDANGRPSNAPAGNAGVPYEQVYGDYARAADEALQRGRVPPEMRDYVRNYFSSLDPVQRNR